MSTPRISSRVDPLGSSVFAVLAKRLLGYTGKRYPFHIGDNVIEPPAGAQWDAVDPAALGVPYRYGHPHGELGLREAIAEKLVRANGMDWITPENVQVSVGATHGITCAFQALLDPGDEVLLLSPYWPLVRGIALCAATRPIDVPLYLALLEDPECSVADLIEPYITPRTRMIYLISPNNPSGCTLTRSQLQQVAEVAQRHDLWVLSDEAYEAYAYAHKHISIATLPGMRDRTISAFTFSKSYALAGTRVGYVCGPAEAITPIRKVATHSVYNTSQACQSAALGALAAGPEFLTAAGEVYRGLAQRVADTLEATFYPAQGGSFVFVDLRKYGPDALPVLERAADRGVTLAPGPLFGTGFDAWARFCYTATDLDTLDEGIAVFNEVLRST